MPYAGGGMIPDDERIPSYFLGGLMKGIGSLSKVASMIPGPWQAPAMAVTGLTSLANRGGGGNARAFQGSRGGGGGQNLMGSQNLPQMGLGGGGGGGAASGGGGGFGSQLMNFFGGAKGLGSFALPIASSLFKHFRGGNQNPQTRGRVMPQYNFPQQFSPPPPGGIAGLPSGQYGNFLQGMQNRYGMMGQQPPPPPPGGRFGTSYTGGMPEFRQQGYGGMRPRMGGGSGMPRQMIAEGGHVRDDIAYEGFIPPTDDGTMESSGAVDDRLALLKPDVSEVTPDKKEMLEVVKEAIRNRDQPWAMEVLQLAREMFGEEFLINLMEDMEIYDNELTPEADQDRMVEMQFREKLANGEEVPVAAAVAPNEYMFPAEAMFKLGNGDPKVGGKIADQVVKDIKIKGQTANRPLKIEVK